MANNSQVAFYVSDSDDEENSYATAVTVLKRKPKRIRNWAFEKTFKNKKEALEFLKTENTWSHHYANNTEDSHKIYFRCNQVKLRGSQCPAGVYLFFDSCVEKEVELFRTQDDHDHSNLVTSKHGLSTEAKTEIEKFFNLKMKPKAILEKLRDSNVDIKNKSQLTTYLRQLKRKKYGDVKISLGVLEQFCIDHKELPHDEDKGFVAAYYVNCDDELDDEEDYEYDDDSF